MLLLMADRNTYAITILAMLDADNKNILQRSSLACFIDELLAIVRG